MGDLGFAGAALVFLFLGPVLALVVRRRWLRATARAEEVRLLVRLAAEEAERAEIEAALSYVTVVMPPIPAASADVAAADGPASAPRPVCAVCFSPTTTRCARCKAVRYCSGKCQIIHWRQGHKDECRPPSVDDKDDDPVNCSESVKIQVEQSGLSDNNLVFEEQQHAKTVEIFSNRPESSESGHPVGFPSQGDDLEEKPTVDLSVAGKTNYTISVLSTPNSISISSTMKTSGHDTAGKEPILFHNAGSGESLSHGSSNGTRTAVDSGDASPTKCSTPDSATANSPENGIPCSDNSEEEEEVTSKDEDGEYQPSSPFNLIRAQSDYSSRKCYENDNKSQGANLGRSSSLGAKNDESPGFHIYQEVCGSSRTSKSTCGASSFEDTGQFNNKETQAVNIVESSNLRSSASVSSVNESVSSGGGHSSARDRSKKVSDAPKVFIRTSGNAVAMANGLTSARRFIKQYTSPKILRHYPSEMSLFPYDLFTKLYNCDKVELRPCGLTNCGNSCYANAVLQCLTFTRPLTAYLLEGLHSRTCSKSEWCFTCEFESLVMKAKQGQSPLSPIGILSHLHKIGSSLSLGGEEDAHEFLRYSIEAMQSMCLKEAGPKIFGQLSEETTLIQLIFGGYLRSKIKCTKCQGKSVQSERMMDLTVEIHGDINTLEEALSRFTHTEVLDGENKYQCNRCKSYERAKKKLTILEAPNVLTIALKRFQSGKFGKLNKAVRFPEYLNLAKYMSATEDKSPVYRLYAVVVHLDIMNAAFSGHYICYVKDIQGKWYKIDDSKVKHVELERVLSENAYMLLYARCSPRAPSSLRKANELVAKKINDRRTSSSVSMSSQEDSSVARRQNQFHPHRMMDDPANFQPFDLLYERFRLKADSSSDSSSLFSCSDEGSWSTESTRDSTSTDEYSEFLFGESDRMSWSSPLRFSEDMDGFAYSASGSNLSSEAVSIARQSDSPVIGGSASSLLNPDKSKRPLTEQCRKVETHMVNPNEVKTNVLLRRPTRERTAQTFY
ncbi:ubiquitin carboxyl-terminal hydrolase 17-like [Typha angustifolia]|uniref:ubiquitin carboxyl-terminal hydrolase 17-like n=1 Tax=Typha angustifolia TaxID=59011 RepID=UPI003C2E3AA4